MCSPGTPTAASLPARYTFAHAAPMLLAPPSTCFFTCPRAFPLKIVALLLSGRRARRCVLSRRPILHCCSWRRGWEGALPTARRRCHRPRHRRRPHCRHRHRQRRPRRRCRLRFRRRHYRPLGTSPTILNHGQDSMAPSTARLQDVRAEYDRPRTTADYEAVQPSVQPNLQPESTARSTGTDVLGLPRTATRLRTSVTARTT